MNDYKVSVNRLGRVLMLFIFCWQTSASTKQSLSAFQAESAYGIGMDFTPSYATIAVSYDYGPKVGIGKISVDDDFRELFKKLSLRSSQHLAPPYNDLGEYYQDQGRQWWRSVRKRFGFPASADVGILARHVQILRDRANQHLGESITQATVSFPKLVALYQEDIDDALEFVGLKNRPTIEYIPTTDASGNYASNNFGLCEHFQDRQLCKDEESHYEIDTVINIHFSEHALIVEIADMVGAKSQILDTDQTFQAFDLGYKNRDTPDYWLQVQQRIQKLFKDREYWWNKLPPGKVFVTGDDSVHDDTFIQILREACSWKENHPEYFDTDTVFMTAKGTAELAKRDVYLHPWIATRHKLEM